MKQIGKTSGDNSNTVTCSICGERLEDITDFAMLEHTYQKHTLDFAKKIVQGVPKIRTLGSMLGAFMRETLKP